MAVESKELALAQDQEVRLPGLPERFQPRNLTELLSWSKLIVSSGLGPKDMNEAGIVLAVQMGAELGVTPTQAIQNICVINGRPSIWGDLGKALFFRDAAYEKFEDRDPAEAKTKGEGWCRITMKDGRVIERIFTRQMATEAKAYERAKGVGPWVTSEGAMLQWRAIWRAMRDADPRVFKGLSSAEEQRDVIDAVDVRIDGEPIQHPRRRSDGVSAADVDGFIKGVKPAPAGGGGGGHGGGAQAAPVDRSTLRKVMILDSQEKKGGGKTFYVISFQGSSGPKLEASTFSSTDHDMARSLKGKFALLATKSVDKGGKTYTNLTHIEPAVDEAAPPPEQDEPGSTG